MTRQTEKAAAMDATLEIVAELVRYGSAARTRWAVTPLALRWVDAMANDPAAFGGGDPCAALSAALEDRTTLESA
jgi:hypothetical protein